MMRSTLSLLVLFAASVAFAEAKTKEEAQAEVDKGKTKSCEVTKKLLNPKFCAEEIQKAAAFDCSAPRSFKTDDLLALSSSCGAKGKAGARGAAEASAVPSATKQETKCKALDSDGARVFESSDTSSLACQRKVKDELTKKCDGSTKKLQYQFVSEVLGKETKPTRLTVYCPKR